MHADSPQVLDRIAGALREGAPRSCGDLARQFLGLGVIDERLADRLLEPLLAADPRFRKELGGWTVRETAAYSSPSTQVQGFVPLWPALAVLAPANLPVAVETVAGDGAPQCSVTLTGEPELVRAEALFGRALPRPVVALTTVARRWRGYRGAADALAIAEALHLPHLEAEGAEGAVQLVACVWHALTAQLATEGVFDHAALAQLLESKLELPQFDGRAFGSEQLDSLPTTPGIYLFRDVRGHVLYVGQSINLAVRVASYFQGPPRDEKDRVIRSEAHALETRPLPTAVDALLTEAKVIRRLRPRLNTRRVTHRPADEDGILLAPREDGALGSVAFVVSNAGLIARVAVPRGPARAAAAAQRAARALFAGRTDGSAGHEAAALIATLRRQRPDLPFLRPAVDGGPNEIASAILAYAALFSENRL